MNVRRPIRILLADPPNSASNPYATTFPNLGLLYLASYVRQHLADAHVRYLSAAYSMAAHLQAVDTFQPDVYGLSLSSSFAGISYDLISDIKRRLPHLPVVCGGPHPTAAPADVLGNSKADFCCIGEGEETFLELVRAVCAGEPVQNVAGIAYRNSAGDIVMTAQRPLIRSLDDIPLPAWDLVDFREFSGCRKVIAQPSTAIVASRGCPFHCTFCSNPVWRVATPWLRLRSPGNIASEVKLLYKRGVREIWILSDEMNPNAAWAVAVFDALAELRLEGLYFQCQLRAKPVTPQLGAAMQRAGCWLCYIGVESSSQRVLDGIGKGVTVQDVETAARVLKKWGIKIYAFIMLYQVWETGGKLQIETPKEVLATLKFVLKMRLKGLIDFMSCGVTTPYPGSELDEIATRYHLRRPVGKRNAVITPQDITMELPGIPLWKIAISRSLGLLAQATLFFLARESYRLGTLRQTVHHAVFKLKYLCGIR